MVFKELTKEQVDVMQSFLNMSDDDIKNIDEILPQAREYEITAEDIDGIYCQGRDQGFALGIISIVDKILKKRGFIL